MRHASLVLAVLAAVPLSAADPVGIFQFSRRSYDPANPQPAAVARDGTIESATLASGDANAGRVNLAEWSGDNQAGGRGVGGINLALPAGTNAYLGLVKDWTLQEGVEGGATWIYYTKFQNDALMVCGFADADPETITLSHGAQFGLENALPYARILFVLPWRWVQGGGSAFQTGAYKGNPPEAGLWAIPAGMSLATAQATPATYQLAGLDTVLNQIRPHVNSTSFKIQILGGGHWQVAIDINDDGVADVVTDNIQEGNKISPFSAMTERSGLLFSSRGAMGSKTGTVGRTTLGLSYRISPTAQHVLVDKRPLVAQIPGFSRTSPAKIFGQQWNSTYSISASSANGPVPLVPVSNYSSGFIASLDLRPDGSPTDIQLQQSGNPPTILSGTTTWQETNIYSSDSVKIRAGDSLLLTYAPNCGPDQVRIDANNDGTWDYIGDGTAGFPYQFSVPGQFTVKAQLVATPNTQDSLTVQVLDAPALLSNRPLVLQIKQKLIFDLDHAAGYLGLSSFSSQFPNWSVSLPTGNIKAAKVDATKISIEVLQRGSTSFLIFPTGSEPGITVPVIGYELDRSGLYAPQIIRSDPYPTSYNSLDPINMVATIKMIPFVPGIRYNLEFFAHRTTFPNGARSFSVTTDDVQTSLGLPGFQIESLGDGTKVGVLTFPMIMPGGEKSWCLKTTQTQIWQDAFR